MLFLVWYKTIPIFALLLQLCICGVDVSFKPAKYAKWIWNWWKIKLKKYETSLTDFFFRSIALEKWVWQFFLLVEEKWWWHLKMQFTHKYSLSKILQITKVHFDWQSFLSINLKFFFAHNKFLNFFFVSKRLDFNKNKFSRNLYLSDGDVNAWQSLEKLSRRTNDKRCFSSR